MAGKLLAEIIHERLNSNIDDKIFPESRYELRRGRGILNMLFVARQLQEKFREQNRNMCMAFIELTKAFDTNMRRLYVGLGALRS